MKYSSVSSLAERLVRLARQSGGEWMPLNFSNESRSYDATRLAVRFWGYDGSREVSFFVTEDALRNLSGDRVLGESECLRAFDAHRPAVYKAAGTAYKRARKGSYELGREDF